MLTWKQVAVAFGGCNPSMLINLSKGRRVGFPIVMHLVEWLGQPASAFIHASN